MKGSVKFFADTPRGEANLPFKFKVNNLADAQACVKRFKAKRYVIRAAWFNTPPQSIRGASTTRII